jgi:O-antigen/teichoic acid export membrane protein
MTSLSLGRPTLLLLLGRFAGYGLALCNSILVARALGAERLGEYAYAMGLAGLFALLPNLGINPVVTRAVAACPEDEGAVLPIAVRTQAFLAILVACAIPLFAALLPVQPVPLTYVTLAAAQLGLGTLGWPYVAVLAGRAAFARVAAVELASALLGTACLLAALLLAGGVPGVLTAHVVAAGIATLVARACTRPARRDAHRPALRVRDLVRQAAPFGATAAVQSLYTRLDVLLLGQLASPRAVGLYSVAYKAPNLLTYVGSTVAGPLFPLMAQTGTTENPVAFQRAVRALAVMGPAVALALSGLAAPILGLLYGADYEAAAPLLVLLAWSAAANWLYAPLAVALQARRCEGWWLASLLTALAVNAAGNLWMIPRWGALGAAAATLVSECVLVAFGAGLLAARLRILPAWRVAAGGLAAAAAGCAALWLGGGGLTGTALGLAAYTLPLLLLRVVTAEDGRLVLGWIRQIAPRAARA